MLKEFWEEKKHVIQLTGILTGVGALFLSIPIPSEESAREALLNIQFIWLIITTGAVFLLLLNLLKLVLVFEAESKKGKGIDLDETISFILIAGIAYFIVNMWVYATSLYTEAFFDFIGIAGYGIGALIVAFTYHFQRKVVLRFQNSRIKAFTLSTLVLILFSGIIGSWLSFLGNRSIFPLHDWALWSVGIFFVLLLISIVAQIKKGYSKI